MLGPSSARGLLWRLTSISTVVEGQAALGPGVDAAEYYDCLCVDEACGA
ncbi:hypothetical protein [Streptomyces cavernae]|nr:hypothetical protein [Streptomyces cavernae]